MKDMKFNLHLHKFYKGTYKEYNIDFEESILINILYNYLDL